MFGTNVIASSWYSTKGSLKVNSIFGTIQGEGPFTGRPCVFLRLKGCNLRCWFCDTEFDRGHVMSLDEVVDAIYIKTQHNNPLLVITGGEPMLQNLTPLCEILLRENWDIQIETAGTVWCERLPDQVTIVCSPKTPTVRSEIENRWPHTHWKYVIDTHLTQVDLWGIPSRDVTQIDNKPRNIARPYNRANVPIWLQPLDTQDQERNNKNLQFCIELCQKHGHRLSLQTHKIIGVP